MQTENQLIRFNAIQREMDRQEQYQHERDISNGVIQLNDLTVSDIKGTVEYILAERQLKSALWYALSKLTEEGFGIIEEFFFLRDKSETIEILGKRHGITRQAYKGRLNRILKRLCKLLQEDTIKKGSVFTYETQIKNVYSKQADWCR